MTLLRFITAGESHGPKLTALLEGMIAGITLDRARLDHELWRRQQSYGAGGRMKIEHDRVVITAGVLNRLTTGAPIALEIRNSDYPSWARKSIPPMTVPRPGHADLTGALKYGYHDLRPALERASARETAARVAIGGVCKQYLEQFGIVVGSYVTSIDAVNANLSPGMPFAERLAAAEASEMRCPDPVATTAMHQAIWEAMQARDTLGGCFEVVALGVPPGLGSHVHFDRRLSGRLAGALLSIQAIKGVEIGPAFENATLLGTQVHDPLQSGSDGAIHRPSNRSGGLEGGITTGEPIVLRAAMKPIATTLTPLPSVDLATGEAASTHYERSDFCAVPRASVVAEAMVAWVLADELIRKLGGDSLAEQLPRFAALPRAVVAALPMDNLPWQFGYETDPS
jgi:chorismate synthase